MQDLKLKANENRGLYQLEAGFDLVGWDEVTQGSVLASFEGDATDIVNLKAEERVYSHYNSYTATVASWRVKKPVFNNPKSLLMFGENEDLETALSQWPEKKKKETK